MDVVVAAPYPEGPLWSQGHLYYTLYSEHKVMDWDGERSVVLWQQKGSGPSGLVETSQQTFLIVCYDANTVVEINRHGSTIKTTDADGRSFPFKGPNDAVRDSRGGIYMTASGTYSVDAPVEGVVYYRPPGGEFDAVADNIHYANGLGLIDGGDRLLVAEMLEQRILAYDVGSDGTLSGRRVFARTDQMTSTAQAESGPLDGPDGLTVDGEGCVYIAQNGSGQVLVTDFDGQLLQNLLVPAQAVTNVALDDSERFLFITAAFDPSSPPYPGNVYCTAPH